MSLARPSSSALRPSTSRRFTSLPRVTATIAPSRLITSTSSGSGLLHTEAGCTPTRAPVPTAAIGGHLLKSSASGPMPTSRYCDHIPLATRTSFTARGLRRAGLDAAQVGSHDRLDLAARPVGQGRVALGALLDHALEQARHEGDAARLDRVQVGGREEPRPRGVARALHAVGRERLERAHRRRGLDRGADLGRRGGVEQAARGRVLAGQVDHLVAAHRDDHRALLGRGPGAPDEQRLRRVPRQAVARGEPGRRAHRSAAYTASTRLATRRSGCRAVPVTYWLVT